jgi:hypothetical protein
MRIQEGMSARNLVFFFLFCCFVLFCFVLFCFVLFCFVLFCFVLFCFVLFCFGSIQKLEFGIWSRRMPNHLKESNVKTPNKKDSSYLFCFLFFVFWFLVFGFWFLVFGFWFLVFGFWFLVFGFWFLVFGFLFFVFFCLCLFAFDTVPKSFILASTSSRKLPYSTPLVTKGMGISLCMR